MPRLRKPDYGDDSDIDCASPVFIGACNHFKMTITLHFLMQTSPQGVFYET